MIAPCALAWLTTFSGMAATSGGREQIAGRNRPIGCIGVDPDAATQCQRQRVFHARHIGQDHPGIQIVGAANDARHPPVISAARDAERAGTIGINGYHHARTGWLADFKLLGEVRAAVNLQH